MEKENGIERQKERRRDGILTSVMSVLLIVY